MRMMASSSRDSPEGGSSGDYLACNLSKTHPFLLSTALLSYAKSFRKHRVGNCGAGEPSDWILIHRARTRGLSHGRDAACLAKKGHKLIIQEHPRCEPAAASGSLHPEALEACDVVMTMLPNGKGRDSW